MFDYVDGVPPPPPPPPPQLFRDLPSVIVSLLSERVTFRHFIPPRSYSFSSLPPSSTPPPSSPSLHRPHPHPPNTHFYFSSFFFRLAFLFVFRLLTSENVISYCFLILFILFYA